MFPGSGAHDADRSRNGHVFTEDDFVTAYGDDNVAVEPHGNVLAAACFLYGFATEDMSEAELLHRDPDYELLMTVRAVRR